MSLYNIVRPSRVCDIIGNDSVVKAIQQLLDRPERPHVYLLKGPVGCGKTTLALILATGFDCKEDNIIKINAAGNNGIDAMRQLSSDARTYGMGGGNKCYILDECHAITKEGWDELLDVLEFCPSHCYFIFCTTEPNKVRKAARSRCTEYELNTLTEEEIKRLLNNVCTLIELTIDPDIIEGISCVCGGSPRDAIQLLEQVIGITNIDEALELIVKGSEKDANVLDLCKMLMADPKLRFSNWKKIIRTFDAIKAEPEVIRKSILTYIYNHLVRCEKDVVAIDYEHLLHIFSVSTFYGGKSALGALIARACLAG